MFETLMTSEVEVRSYLNSMPESEYRRSQARHDRIWERTDELIARGVHWEKAYDQAIREVLR